MSGSKRLLITGASGFLGSNIALVARDRYDTVGTYYRTPTEITDVTMRQADLASPDAIDTLSEIDPDWIIHCAAETDVDFCETNRDAAYRTNVTAAEHVAEAAADCDARLVHISTDAVFDGRDGNYTETDTPNPLNVYGETKMTAERRVSEIHDRALVIRTNIFGWSRDGESTLAEWMLQELQSDRELPAIGDARFSPVLVTDLAEIIFELLDTECSGQLHVGATDSCTKLEFAEELAAVFGYDTDEIDRIELADLDFTAKRGKDLSLDVSKAESVLGRSLPRVRDGVVRFQELETGSVKRTLTEI